MKEGTIILIVDDNEPMRMLIRSILVKAGYSLFLQADDGTSAYKILKEQKVDLIISDWNMLGMTGIDLLKKVRGDQDIARTPFIMVSVEGLTISKKQAFASGANGFVTKPFSVKALTDSVAKVMGQTASIAS